MNDIFDLFIYSIWLIILLFFFSLFYTQKRLRQIGLKYVWPISGLDAMFYWIFLRKYKKDASQLKKAKTIFGRYYLFMGSLGLLFFIVIPIFQIISRSIQLKKLYFPSEFIIYIIFFLGLYSSILFWLGLKNLRDEN